jgi:hypothetical protein
LEGLLLAFPASPAFLILILTFHYLVDGHAAVLIQRLLDLTRIEMVPSELIWWSREIHNSDLWKEASKGQDTMGWGGRPSLQEVMTMPDLDEPLQPNVKGKGRAE